MTTQLTNLSAQNLAETIAEFAEEKKALDIVILDMSSVVNFCDYFVLCSGNTDRQVGAIADAIDVGLSELGHTVNYRKQDRKSTWVVLDAGTVIIHIFEKKVREFYNLEYLWREANRIK